MSWIILTNILNKKKYNAKILSKPKHNIINIVYYIIKFDV